MGTLIELLLSIIITSILFGFWQQSVTAGFFCLMLLNTAWSLLATHAVTAQGGR